jgi:membrane associated rhomboid family serine protease
MSITLIIVIVTVLASMYAWNNGEIYHRWILNPYQAYHRKEYYRFFTSGLIHADYPHLLVNMFTLYFLGSILESYYVYILGTTGMVAFVALYVLGIVVSDIPTFLKHKDSPHYNSLGASGGVSSVVFGAILFSPVSELCLYFFLCMPAIVFAVLYLVYSYYQGKRGGDNINHDAHLYGALFGIIFTIIFVPESISIFISEISNWDLLRGLLN